MIRSLSFLHGTIILRSFFRAPSVPHSCQCRMCKYYVANQVIDLRYCFKAHAALPPRSTALKSRVQHPFSPKMPPPSPGKCRPLSRPPPYRKNPGSAPALRRHHPVHQTPPRHHLMDLTHYAVITGGTNTPPCHHPVDQTHYAVITRWTKHTAPSSLGEPNTLPCHHPVDIPRHQWVDKTHHPVITR